MRMSSSEAMEREAFSAPDVVTFKRRSPVYQKCCIVCHKKVKEKTWIEARGICMHFDCMKKLRDAREACYVRGAKCYTDDASNPGRKCDVVLKNPPVREPSPGGSR